MAFEYNLRKDIEDLINGSKAHYIDPSEATFDDYYEDKVKNTLHIPLKVHWKDLEESIADLFKSIYFIGHVSIKTGDYSSYTSLFTKNLSPSSIVFKCMIYMFQPGLSIFQVDPICTVEQIGTYKGELNDNQDDIEKIRSFSQNLPLRE